MANFACKRCGAEERNQRGDCLPCKRARRALEYARKMGRAPEPVAKPHDEPLWRFDEVDAATDATKRRTLMAALWDAFILQEYFQGEPVLDETHMDEMRDMPAVERYAFRDAAAVEFVAKQKAARLGRR